MEYSNTGILQPMLLQYWDLLNSYSIHIITVYIIQQGHMLSTFFHTNIHYFTQILKIYLRTLYMHNFSHVFKNVDLLFTCILVLLHIQYILRKQHINSYIEFTQLLTHFLQCLRSIVTLQLLFILQDAKLRHLYGTDHQNTSRQMAAIVTKN